MIKSEIMALQSKSNALRNKYYCSKLAASAKRKSYKNKSKKYDVKTIKKYDVNLFQDFANITHWVSPSVETAFKVLLSARLCAALWNNINDCDETYNFWEPTHFLLFGKGFQTWEYSPAYALRSYTYILLHVAPVWIFENLLKPNRMLIFYFLRCFLGTFCACCESYFYKSVSKEFGFQVGRMVLVFLVFSPGMFISSVAFLPSSFSMYMCFLSTAAWINKKYELAIFSVALSTFISWPFAALTGLPMALDMLFIKKNHNTFFKWSAIATIVILIPLIKMDSELYGQFVIAPLNIVLYNVFTNHGPDLYGSEPICYYLINGVLNFNVVFIAAILAPSFLLLRNFIVTHLKIKGEFFNAWLILAPFYIWFVVFTLQPHKEERFLFPIYPLICLCGAVCIHSIQIIYSVSVTNVFGKPSRRLNGSNIISITVVILSVLLSISRIAALYRGYHAPLNLWLQLNKFYAEGQVEKHIPVNICVGKEWHRFPTSFFLPQNWYLKFLKSEFRGQLPAEYSPYENSAAIIHSHFNDLNQEETSRYFDIEKCHLLIDCDVGKFTNLEPNYTCQSDKWTVVWSFPFLDAEKSHPFFRAFYIPFVSDEYCTYAHYNLLQSTKFCPNSENN